MFLKVSPWKGIMRFGKKDKLASRFVGPSRILQRVEKFPYRLDLPPNSFNVHPVFHVSMLMSYKPDPSHMIEYSDLIVEEDASYAVTPLAIIFRDEKVIWGKSISLVRVV